MNAIELAESIELTDCRADELATIYVAAKELRRLHAENESLRKDAGRYRWLRNPEIHVGNIIDKRTTYNEVTDFGTGGYWNYEYRAGEDLDQAIDAAMGEGK